MAKKKFRSIENQLKSKEESQKFVHLTINCAKDNECVIILQFIDNTFKMLSVLVNQVSCIKKLKSFNTNRHHQSHCIVSVNVACRMCSIFYSLGPETVPCTAAYWVIYYWSCKWWPSIVALICLFLAFPQLCG